MTPTIVYQDTEMLVIDKPAGLVVNRADSVKEETVQDWIAKNFPFDSAQGKQFPLAHNEDFRNGIVHRLDKDTSGILVIAKTREAFDRLTARFRHREIHKTYLALVHGKLEPAVGTVRLPIKRSSRDRHHFQVAVGGREAETSWEVVDRFGSGEGALTFLKLFPKTGRTHQLRVHVAHLHHPIVADSRYGGARRAAADRAWCPRQFLHAHRLCVGADETNCFEAPLPEDLQRALVYLRARNKNH